MTETQPIQETTAPAVNIPTQSSVTESVEFGKIEDAFFLSSLSNNKGTIRREV